MAPGQRLTHEAGLHRRSPDLAPEPQRAVRSEEVVVTAEELNVLAKLVFTSRVRCRPTVQVSRALTNRQVEALDERRVQRLGILRLQQGFVQAASRADLQAPFKKSLSCAG